MTGTEIATTGKDPGPSTDLVTRLETLGVPDTLREKYDALDTTSDVLEIVIENMGGEFEDIPLNRMPRIKFPTGGETLFNVPDSTNPNGVRQERRLTGLMVVNQTRRAYWPSVDLTGDRPACFSLDGKVGEGEFGPGSQRNPRGRCGQCPMAQYGTKAELHGARADAGGQACKQTRLLYLLLPGAALPYQLSVPPASLKVIEDFLLGLANARTPFYGIEAELSLQRVEGENPYAQLVISSERVLTAEEAAATKVYNSALKVMLQNAGDTQIVREMADAEGTDDSGEASGGISFGEPESGGGFDDVATSNSEGDYNGEAAGATASARSGARNSSKG